MSEIILDEDFYEEEDLEDSYEDEPSLKELILKYDEDTGTWGIAEEPYATLEIPTEEEFNYIQDALKFYKEYLESQHKE